MKLTVEVSGAEAIRAHFAKLDGATKLQALAKTAVEVERYVHQQADRHTQTGALVQSIYSRRIDGGYEIGHDLQRAKHAVFVHWGTKPHEIRPDKKQALRYQRNGVFWFWFGPKSPAEKATIRKWVKAKGYGSATRIMFKWPHHPGYKGDEYMTRAARYAITTFERIVHESIAGQT